MKHFEIVGLGLATVDILVRLEDMPTWERGGKFSAVKMEGGGMVATAMCASARLGASVAYIGTAGTDALGLYKRRSLEEYGVDITHVASREGTEAQIVLVYVNERDGERIFTTGGPLQGKVLAADELDFDSITSAPFLHLDGFHYAAALEAAKRMRDAQGKVVFDGSKTSGRVSDDHRALLEYVDVLITGAGYLQGLTGRDDIREAGKAALDLGPGIVVQTEGEEGCNTFSADGTFHTPPFDIDVVDTTGAGDVFHGAYLVGLLRGWDLETLANFSSAVSALVCTQLGGRSGIPTFDEVTAFLHDRDIQIP